MHNDFLKLKKQIFYFPGRYVKNLKKKNPKHPKTQITKKHWARFF
jgi:hypothetical protein